MCKQFGGHIHIAGGFRNCRHHPSGRTPHLTLDNVRYWGLLILRLCCAYHSKSLRILWCLFVCNYICLSRQPLLVCNFCNPAVFNDAVVLFQHFARPTFCLYCRSTHRSTLLSIIKADESLNLNMIYWFEPNNCNRSKNPQWLVGGWNLTKWFIKLAAKLPNWLNSIWSCAIGFVHLYANSRFDDRLRASSH